MLTLQLVSLLLGLLLSKHWDCTDVVSDEALPFSRTHQTWMLAWLCGGKIPCALSPKELRVAQPVHVLQMGHRLLCVQGTGPGLLRQSLQLGFLQGVWRSTKGIWMPKAFSTKVTWVLLRLPVTHCPVGSQLDKPALSLPFPSSPHSFSESCPIPDVFW